MREPATALTDYLLAVIAFVFLSRLSRADAEKGLIGARTLFLGFALSALVGGTWHGFFSGDDDSNASRQIWWLTMTFTGVAAAGLALIGLERFGVRNPRALLLVNMIFVVGTAIYAARDTNFLVTLIATGAATVICLAGLIFQARRHPRSGAGLVAAGLALSLLAAVLQRQRVGLHPVHFDHNAVYHLWLVPALTLIYMGSRRISAGEPHGTLGP